MPDKHSASAILVVGPAWVGDMVMAQVLFRLLKQHQPDCAIDVIAPAWSAPLLARMPEVRASFDLPLKHGEFGFAARKHIGLSLREKYRQAILLPNSWKSALVPFFGAIPQRTGWRGEMRYGLLNDIRTLDKQKYPLMIERFAALAFEKNAPLPAQLPQPRLLINDAERTAALHKHQLTLDRPVLALCPGAEFGPAKRWPEQHYATLAASHIATGGQVWLFGSEKDREITEQICRSLPADAQVHCANLAGRTTLAEAIDLLSCADAVVSNDSGLMHIAAALNRPLVAVYGSSSPQFTPPLADAVEIVRLGLDCSPCFKRECPLGHLRCLNDLPPSRVQEALGRLPHASILKAAAIKTLEGSA
jgi:heptosyltransferase-2